MSRLFLVLATTLVVLIGSLIFILTFERGSKLSPPPASAASSARAEGKPTRSRRLAREARISSSRRLESSLSLPSSATTHLDQEQVQQVEDILARTRREARETLDKYDTRYQLSKNQRQEIFPYIVAHHPQAHPEMIVNGQPLPAIAPGTSLEERVSSFLNPSQQTALIEDSMDDQAWWEEVVGQLESDLDNAISDGEMVPADERAVPPPVSREPASGDGEASERPGANLFDLLGQ